LEDPMSRASKLRAMLKQDGMIVAPGAYDCITARTIAQAGFSAVYMTGAGTAATLGYPDYGIITMSEMADNAGRIATAVKLPVIADAEEAGLLGVDEGSPLMLIERTAFTASGVAVEYARDVFRADRTRITLRTGLGRSARSEMAADGHVASSS